MILSETVPSPISPSPLTSHHVLYSIYHSLTCDVYIVHYLLSSLHQKTRPTQQGSYLLCFKYQDQCLSCSRS